MKQDLFANHYVILGLPFADAQKSSVSPNDIKSAYRRALLRHHPDKSSVSTSASTSTSTKSLNAPNYTTDQILLAYKILIDPSSRSRYDQSLRVAPSRHFDGEKSHPGLETVDLDDFAFDETQAAWHRACRCGNERGFVITEGELEADAEIGEVVTGCRGCSLWLSVTFVATEED